MATMSLYPGLPIPAFFELHGQPLVVNNPLRPALLYNGRQWVGLYDPRWRLEADQISRREWDELLNGAAPPEGV